MIPDFDFVTCLLGSSDKIVSQGKNGTSHEQILMNDPDMVVGVEGSSMLPMGHPFTVGFEATFENEVITYFEDGSLIRWKILLKCLPTQN
jgi:UDP-N-acetylglucosamine 3-dehydrogenase